MELKPGYKLTEVGVIPEDWGDLALADVSTKIGSGITPTGGSSRYRNVGRPFVRSQNIGWGRLILDDIAFIDEGTHEQFAGTEIMPNDVLLNITGASIGRCAIADERVGGGNVNQHVCIVRPDRKRTIGSLIKYALLSATGQQQIDSFQAGGNRQGLNFQQVAALHFPLPPTLLEQIAIATALSDADDLIEALENLLAKKRLIKQGAMQELLTGKRRLPGFSGEWVVRRLGELVQLRQERLSGHSLGSNQICVELEHLEQGTGRLIGHTNPSSSSSLKSVFRQNDVLFGKLRAYLRKFFLTTFDGVCSTEIWVLSAKTALLFPKFLVQLVATDSFVDAASSAYGTHMPRSDWSVVKNYEITLPPILEQTAIATVLSDMDAEIDALQAKIDKARQIKQGMMQELLTGRIRLI